MAVCSTEDKKHTECGCKGEKQCNSGCTRRPFYATRSGNPVGQPRASLSSGPRGPLLLADFQLLDKLQHFDRERIPERVVHANGAGAHGYFLATNRDFCEKFSTAKVLKVTNEKVPVFVRFSTVTGERFTSDFLREPRGFALRLYTQEGNWDLVMNDIPTFFLRDPIKFVDMVHAQKRNPASGLINFEAKWEFFLDNPETTATVFRIFSPMGVPLGYRNIHGFTANTFCVINKDEEVHLARFATLTQQGEKFLTTEQAEGINATNPDHSAADLYNAIAAGDFPAWEFVVQVMSLAEAAKLPFDPLDPTKTWPETEFPFVKLGRIVLDRNPENYFAEVEQAAFCPGHLVPGIGLTADKLLQGRVFSYSDTHLHRLGPNFFNIPINQPINRAVAHPATHRDGLMTVDDNRAKFVHVQDFKAVLPPAVLQPTVCEFVWNPTAAGVAQAAAAAAPAAPAGTNAATAAVRYEEPIVDEDFRQVRDFWRLELDDERRKLTIENFVRELKTVPPTLQQGWVDVCRRVDVELAERLTEALRVAQKGNEAAAAAMKKRGVDGGLESPMLKRQDWAPKL